METILSFFDHSSCIFHELTGLYCPGCGGTRAFFALLKGDLVRSLLFHPVVAYGYLCLAAAAFILARGVFFGRRHTDPQVVKRQTKAALERFILHALTGAAILLLMHFILRNALLLLGIPAFP